MKRLLIASLVTMLIVFAVKLVVTAIDSIGSDFSDLRFTLFMAAFAAFIASVVVLLWAIPIHRLLNRFKHVHAGWYLLSAVIPSFAFIDIIKPFGQDLQIYLFQQALFCSFAGALGAWGFWYVAVYRHCLLVGRNG